MRYNVRMEDILSRHYAALLGLGEEWNVTDVKLDVAARRVDISTCALATDILAVDRECPPRSVPHSAER